MKRIIGKERAEKQSTTHKLHSKYIDILCLNGIYFLYRSDVFAQLTHINTIILNGKKQQQK